MRGGERYFSVKPYPYPVLPTNSLTFPSIAHYMYKVSILYYVVIIDHKNEQELECCRTLLSNNANIIRVLLDEAPGKFA